MTDVADIRPLTAKQQAFVVNFTDFANPRTYCNATQSAITAQYKGSNGVLRAIGCENLTKPNVEAAIKAIQAKRQAKVEYNQQIATEQLDNLIDRCKTAKDRTVEAACIREKNTIYALRTEKVLTGSLEQAEALNDKQKEEAQAIATIRLTERLAEITIHEPE